MSLDPFPSGFGRSIDDIFDRFFGRDPSGADPFGQTRPVQRLDISRLLSEQARELLTTALPLITERGVTLIGVAVGNLDDQGEQLMLPLEHPADGGLDTALDAVRERFGSSAVMRAALLGRGEGVAVPLLPD